MEKPSFTPGTNVYPPLFVTQYTNLLQLKKLEVKISCQNADIDFSRETLIQVTLCATKSC